MRKHGVDVKQIVGDHLDKSRGVVDGHGGGFVQIFAKLAPEKVKHEFGSGFASGNYLDLGAVEVDTLSQMVLSNVLALLLVGLGPVGVTGRLLFAFQALVHVVGKEAFLECQTSWIFSIS